MNRLIAILLTAIAFLFLPLSSSFADCGACGSEEETHEGHDHDHDHDHGEEEESEEEAEE